MNIASQTSEYWATVHRHEAELPEVVYLVTADLKQNLWKGGMFKEVNRRTGAMCLAGGTHRLANKEEVEKWQRDMAASVEAARKKAIDDKSVHIHYDVKDAEATRKGK